jgi:hypothetical protein
MFSTVPVGAIQDMTVASTSFSSEFGWTSGPAINVVTKSGTNDLHGDALIMGRPSDLQKKSFGTGNLCPPSIATCQPASGGTAITSISPADTPDSLLQGSFSVGGALKADRTFYFAAADFTGQDRTAPLTTSVSPVPSYIGNYRQALFDGRVDHNLSRTHHLMVRFNLDRFTDNNPQDAISGSVLPSAGRTFTRHTYSTQFNDTMILSSNMVNEARFEYQDADPVTNFTPITPSPQFTRTGTAPFTAGESRFADVTSSQGQFSDTLSWTIDKHYIRMGGSIAHNTSGGNGTEFGSAFVNGQFTFANGGAAGSLPIDQLTLANVTSYVQSFSFCNKAVAGNDKVGACIPDASGNATYKQEQWMVAGFVQDTYRVRRDLTADLGLRYDRQTMSDGVKNLAPRFGFAWNPWNDPKTAVRGGYGVYYTLIRANNAANFVLNGPDGIFTYSAAPGQTGFPTCLPAVVNGVPQTGPCAPVPFNPNAALSTLPARNITIRPGERDFYTKEFANYGVDFSKLPNYPDALVNPKSQVGTIGFERELRPHVFLSADYVHQHWTNLDQTVDLNAPSVFVRTAANQIRSVATADATRPITPTNGGFRQINVVESIGIADYNGLQTTLSYKGSTRIYASLSYTLSKATNTTEPDGNGAGPNDFNQVGPQFENAPSLLDQRHRAVITFTYRLPWYNLMAGTVTQMASARPFNATTGNDNNGDGVRNDRPVINGAIVGRDAFRGTATYDASIFVESRIHFGHGRDVTLRLEGFNVFNHANILGRFGTYGDTVDPNNPNSTLANANFGQPGGGTATSIGGVFTSLPGLAAIDPSRMVQLSARFSF